MTKQLKFIWSLGFWSMSSMPGGGGEPHKVLFTYIAQVFTLVSPPGSKVLSGPALLSWLHPQLFTLSSEL